MKVKFIKNRDSETPGAPFPIYNPREYLEIGKSYTVYGILLMNKEIQYLIEGEYSNSAEWEPAELFEVVSNKIPTNWYFSRAIEQMNKNKLNDPNVTLFGYKELALDIYHNDKLIEREVEALRTFTMRKEEIDELE